MSEGNGKSLKVECGSTRSFEFPGGYLYPCDVLYAFDLYLDVRRGFVGEDDRIPRERMTEFHDALVGWVNALIASAAPANKGRQPPDLDAGHALRFVTMLAEENDRLADFFVPASRAKSSIPQSSELTFTASEAGSSAN